MAGDQASLVVVFKPSDIFKSGGLVESTGGVL